MQRLGILRPERLAANARPFRYLAYPVIGVGFLVLDRPGLADALAVISWCLLWPLAVDLGQRGRSATFILRAHLLEAGLVGALFTWAGMAPNLVLATGIILIVSNALQGGIIQALAACACVAVGVLLGLVIGPRAAWMNLAPAHVLAVAILLPYCGLIGHVAHSQALANRRQRQIIHGLNQRLAQYLPESLTERLHQAPGRSLERRWLAVLFVDLAGFTALVEKLATEELSALVNAYMQILASVAAARGGSLSKVLGDGAMIVFGESDQREHRALVQEALACCRALEQALRQIAQGSRSQGLPAPLRLKAGLASGWCSLGDWGGERRLEYTVIGQPVNLASRLEGLARAGEVLVCERSGLLLQEAQTADAEICEVKGLGRVRLHRLRC